MDRKDRRGSHESPPPLLLSQCQKYARCARVQQWVVCTLTASKCSRVLMPSADERCIASLGLLLAGLGAGTNKNSQSWACNTNCRSCKQPASPERFEFVARAIGGLYKVSQAHVHMYRLCARVAQDRGLVLFLKSETDFNCPGSWASLISCKNLEQTGIRLTHLKHVIAVHPTSSHVRHHTHSKPTLTHPAPAK